MTSLISVATRILIALSILIGSASAFAGASMTGFEMHHCTPTKKCLSLNGLKADQSFLMKMWVVKNSTLKIVNENDKSEIRTWNNKTVYFDESAKELTVKDPENSKEWFINLDTLETVEFKL